MPTPILKKIKYSDDQRAIIDAINKNFASLEFLLANGKLDGVNINSKYVGKVAAETIETMSLTVGENVNIGEATKTFVTQLADETPTPPYHTGDNWVNVFDGNLYTCLFSRESGEFSMSDWIYSSQYVQPSGVTTIVNGVVTTDFVNALGITAHSVRTNWVYAGDISADQITSGRISATISIDSPSIYGGKLYGTRSGDPGYLMVGNKGNLADLSLYRGGGSYPAFQVYDEGGGVTLKSENDSFLFVNGDEVYLYGYWDFSDARIEGDLIQRSNYGGSLGSLSRRWDYLYVDAVNTSGNVGIAGGLINKNAYQTDETGRTVIVDSAGNFGSESSTIRKKENVELYHFDLDALLKLGVVSFNMKPEFSRYTGQKYGVIAEQALEIGLPELVGYDEEGNVDYFAYDKLSLPVLQLVQRQEKKINDLESRLEALESRLEALDDNKKL